MKLKTLNGNLDRLDTTNSPNLILIYKLSLSKRFENALKHELNLGRPYKVDKLNELQKS